MNHEPRAPQSVAPQPFESHPFDASHAGTPAREAPILEAEILEAEILEVRVIEVQALSATSPLGPGGPDDVEPRAHTGDTGASPGAAFEADAPPARPGAEPIAAGTGGALPEEDLVELYAAGSSIEADRLVHILEDDEIEALSRATTAAVLPTSGEQHFIVVVPAHTQGRARLLVEEAIRDGVVSETGAFLVT